MGNQRECGVLLPISSLPSKYGIGCFSKSAYEFVDQLKAAGQGCWQILPFGPTSYGDSPYQSFSTFAGNPYFISLEDLIEEGVLTEKECDAVDFGSREDDVDYEKIYKGRYKLLRKAYERSDISKNPDFVRFQQEQAHWLGDYALFMAVKDRFEGIPWTEWAEDIRLRWNNALDYYRKECPDTYFIVISGYSEFVYAQRALTLGVKDYIDKPVTADKLKNALTRIEDEWAKTRHEDNRKAQANREKFLELERIFESSVKCITNCDAAAFREECRQTIRCLQELYPELQDFRREFYKHLCVLSDVLIESQKQVERGSLVSFQEMVKCQSIEEVQAYGESVLSDISKHLTADQTGSKHRVILELLTYLDEHYDQDIGLSELADRAGMSTAYLSVLFKTEVGTSYVKYLTDLRIKKAKKLLQDGYKVNEVSEMVGYNNYRYFCDIFKKHEGMTPNEYKGNVWKAE